LLRIARTEKNQILREAKNWIERTKSDDIKKKHGGLLRKGREKPPVAPLGVSKNQRGPGESLSRGGGDGVLYHSSKRKRGGQTRPGNIC